VLFVQKKRKQKRLGVDVHSRKKHNKARKRNRRKSGQENQQPNKSGEEKKEQN
jgi:hypothetical protein